jgi:N6-L-threonylcarbamoyladenine synthase
MRERGLGGESTLVLGIDTSCDDTGVGIVRDGVVLANVIASQALHREFGGVMPELASRAHLSEIDRIVQLALEQAGVGLEDMDVIAATRGPGLAGSLLVGFTYARGLAFALGKRFYAMHHLEGHIQSALASEPSLEPPFLALIASGGHTHLFDCAASGVYTLVGATRDDAAGEAFDKVARLLGLGFPGGPAMAKAALEGDPHGYPFSVPLQGQSGFEFSYSGLKNAARLAVEARDRGEVTASVADLAASFQRVVVEALVKTTARAAKRLQRRVIVVAGGVAANRALREAFARLEARDGLRVLFPPAELNTDNGAMIALAGFVRAARGDGADGFDSSVVPYWALAANS